MKCRLICGEKVDNKNHNEDSVDLCCSTWKHPGHPRIWAITKEWEGVLILQHRQNTYLPQVFAHAAPGDVGQGGDGDVVVVLVPRHFGETAAGREEVEGD